MLARKYYAQRGTSKGGNMNTRAVAASSSAVMRKRKLYGNQIVVKNVQDRSSSEKITFVKTKVLRCGKEAGNNPTMTGASCEGKVNVDNKCPTINVVKNPGVAVSQEEHIENVVASVNCDNDDFWGTSPEHKGC